MGIKWKVDANGYLTNATFIGNNEETTGNPNGVVVGHLGDCLFDVSSSVMYKCISKPTGSVWTVV